jgi:hypothetical protein
MNTYERGSFIFVAFPRRGVSTNRAPSAAAYGAYALPATFIVSGFQ